MAIGSFGRNRNEQNEQEAVPVVPPSPTNSGRTVTALIDQGSRCEGKLLFRDAVRIDGSFSGEISSENTLIVGETGEIEADIRSARVIVSGSVAGDIRATAQIVLHKSARVEGDLVTPSLVVETGAVLKGRVDMSPAAKSTAATSLKAVPSGSEKAQGGPVKAQGGPAKAQGSPAKGPASSGEGSKRVAN